MFDIGILQPAYRDKYYASADDNARLQVICTFLNDHFLPNDDFQVLHKEVVSLLDSNKKNIQLVLGSYLNQFQIIDANELANTALKNSSDDEDGFLEIFLVKGYINCLVHNDFSLIEQAYKKVKKIKDKTLFVDLTLNIVSIVTQLSLHEKSILILHDAINALPKSAKEECIRLNLELTKSLIDNNQLTSAEQTIDVILELKKSVNQPALFVQLLLLQAKILYLQKEFQSAAEIVNECIEVSVTSGINFLLGEAYLLKGKICLACKEYSVAGDALEKSLAHLSSEIKNTSTSAELYELLSTVHSLKKNYKLALEYHKAFYQKQYLLQQSSTRLLNQKNILVAKFLIPSAANVISEQEPVQEKVQLKPSEKKQDLRESVFYLKHIQKELLPGRDTIYNLFPDSFIIYKPKSHVSNHFFWFARSNSDQDKVYIAVAQSIANDTAGAYMSMIATNKLNKALFDEKFNLPGVMLSYLNTRIKTTFKQSTAEQLAKLGFDMAICAFDLDSHRMIYSGANLGLLKYTIDHGVDIEPTKASVGGNTSAQQTYIDHKRELTTGDTFYLMTNGIYNLSGGDKGKNLGEKKFKEVLQSIQNISMIEQERYINEFLNRWIGDNEQLEDILIIGIRA